MALRNISLVSRSSVVATATTNGAGSQYVIETPGGVLYVFFVSNSVLLYVKSTDSGKTWSAQTQITAKTTIMRFSVWYDRWSNISAGLIHCAYNDTATDTTTYRTVDTENSDTLSTETIMFDGASTANGGTMSICRARGGNVYCATMIDAGAEGGFFRLPNANVPNGAWDVARTTVFEAATQDQILLVPGWSADNQDMMAFYWDADADEISRKIYDDGDNTWAETSIAATMADVAATSSYPHFAAAVDLTNSQNLLVAWSAVDTVDADLRCWAVTEGTITETSTNVVQNSVDDQGLCAISIDSLDKWHVFYFGKSDGTETYNPAVSLYQKTTTDSGATWSDEVVISTPMAPDFLMTAPRTSLAVPPCISANTWNIGVVFSHYFIRQPTISLRLGM